MLVGAFFFTINYCFHHLHLVQPMSVPMSLPREASSMVKTTKHRYTSIANTVRLFVHAMPNAMNTKVEHKQVGTPKNLQVRKIRRTLQTKGEMERKKGKH